MISIIVCTYNRDCYIRKTLDCLAKCDADRTDFEILLIDNNCTDNTANICHEFEVEWSGKLNYRYFVETKQGLSNARNRGIDEARGDFIVYLDDDAFVAADYIRNLKRYLVQYKGLAAFGGKIDPYYESGVEPAWMSKWSYSWVSAIDYGTTVRPFTGNDYPIGANMGVRVDLAKKAGGFNPNLGRLGKNTMSGEEKDFFNKIKALGETILYFPDVSVQHCIPENRLTIDFIRKMGEGIGISEKQRTLDISHSAYFKRLFEELVKWGGTIVIWLLFFLQGKLSKGNVLVTFRYHVTKGLFGKL